MTKESFQHQAINCERCTHDPMIEINTNITSIIGKGYSGFWNNRSRYRINKGGRASKKSCNVAIWFVIFIMGYWHTYGLKPNLLVLRRYYNTHKNSTRAQLVWAIYRLGIERFWRIPKGDNNLVYIPSGQQIIFKGLDDPQSITSITVANGHLCWVWWEEAYQVNNEDDFNKIDLSIRGRLPAPLFYQHTLTLNPWSDQHWIKRRFFDKLNENDKPIKEDVYTMTSTYLQNEFLDAATINTFEIMKTVSPKRYKIEGLGEWGISEGLIYENWSSNEWFDIDLIREQTKGYYGLDFGYTDPTAFVEIRHKKCEYVLYIVSEFYETTMSNKRIVDRLQKYSKCKIIADSAEPRTINELKSSGLYGITGSAKGRGSRLAGIQKLQDYKLIVHPSCTNTIAALNNYAWKTDKQTGKALNEPEHDFSHIPDAMRYATEDLNKIGLEFA